MITRQLLILQIALLALFAWGAHAGCGVGWGLTLAWAIAAYLLLMAVILAVTWGFAWRYLSPTEPIGPIQVLRMLGAEYVASLFTFGLLLPWTPLFMRADRLMPHAHPVLLVHGYGCNRACWWWMRRELESAGYVVGTITMEPPWGSIDDMVPQLKQRIQDVLAATGASQVTLVVHSMGGLVSRAYIKQFGRDAVAGLITIATPHHGTEIARLGIGQDARQMEPNSAWQQALGEAPLNMPFASIRTPHDNIVMPQDTQRMPDALDLPLPATGHLAALFSRRALALVLQQLPK